MKIVHAYFGKDANAEPSFVPFLNALAARDMEQTAIVRPGRSWRRDLDPSVRIFESRFSLLSFDRLLLPLRVKLLLKGQEPQAVLCWGARASQVLPGETDHLRICRLSDYPATLGAMKNADLIVAVRPDIVEHVLSLGWRKPVEIIPQVAGTEKVKPVNRLRYDTPEDATVILAMGRFEPRKRLGLLIDIVSQMPGVYLWLVGAGEEESSLRARVERQGIADRARFFGWQKDPRSFIAACDIFALPSRSEPHGSVILEAWAQDKPVVSTRCEGPDWFTRDGENALLVDVDDAAGFRDAIMRLINNMPLGAKIASGGRRTLMNQFSEEAVIAAYIDLIGRAPDTRR